SLPGVAELVVEQRLIPAEVTLDRLAVGIEQELGALAAQAARGIVRPVHAVAVTLSRRDAGQVAMPDEAIDLGQLDPGLGELVLVAVGRVKQAKFHTFRDLGEQSEIRAPSVPRRT